jgi:DNA-binding response OmpR family regulator
MFTHVRGDGGPSDGSCRNRTSQVTSIQCLYDPSESTAQLGHISDHDLERHYLGMVTDLSELAEFEVHLLCCAPCVERAEEAQDYVDAMRVAGVVLRETESAPDPIVSGIELCRQISENERPVEIPTVAIMMTLSESTVELAPSLAAGDVIGKSNDTAILWARLQSLLRRRSIQQTNRGLCGSS